MKPATPASEQSTGVLHVLVFGSQAHSVGTDRLDIDDLQFPTTVVELMTKIATVYPAIASSLGVSRIAINHEFAAGDSEIRVGDEVALIGLISGG